MAHYWRCGCSLGGDVVAHWLEMWWLIDWICGGSMVGDVKHIIVFINNVEIHFFGGSILVPLRPFSHVGRLPVLCK